MEKGRRGDLIWRKKNAVPLERCEDVGKKGLGAAEFIESFCLSWRGLQGGGGGGFISGVANYGKKAGKSSNRTKARRVS